MQIKRFVAQTMRQALAEVRAEQGEDAVIISNRRIDGGIELITAVDYDETLIDDALKRVRSAPASAEPVQAATRQEPVPAARVAEPPAQPAKPARPAAAAPAPVAEPPRVVRQQDDGMLEMRREVENLRALLQDQLASLAWSDRLRREPLKALVLRDLSLMGLAPDVARGLADTVPAATSGAVAARIAPALLMRSLPTVEDDLLTTGGIVALVGPTGVGKTTSIAKLAARWALRHGSKDVALVSLDHYRIGAREQLLTFARILGVPMHVATNARELGAVLASLADRRLVLIDTAGMSPRDVRLAEQFATLSVPGMRIRTLLTLAANADHLALEELVRCYSRVRPDGVVLTKLDEAASFGPALSVAMRHALPFAWLGDGQRVPDDFHAAAPKRVWLVKGALKLATRSRSFGCIDDAYLAEHFGKVAING